MKLRSIETRGGLLVDGLHADATILEGGGEGSRGRGGGVDRLGDGGSEHDGRIPSEFDRIGGDRGQDRLTGVGIGDGLVVAENEATVLGGAGSGGGRRARVARALPGKTRVGINVSDEGEVGVLDLGGSHLLGVGGVMDVLAADARGSGVKVLDVDAGEAVKETTSTGGSGSDDDGREGGSVGGVSTGNGSTVDNGDHAKAKDGGSENGVHLDQGGCEPLDERTHRREGGRGGKRQTVGKEKRDETYLHDCGWGDE